MSAPAWKNAPDSAGTWLTNGNWVYVLTERMLRDFADYESNKTRYYGPIPKDKS